MYSWDVEAFEASYILSYNVVKDHEGDIHQGVSSRAVSDKYRTVTYRYRTGNKLVTCNMLVLED